ncbi:MAG: metallophosphoesterase, partial [Lentimicrobiaceae bacterium]|nr:metallophosphoesterase [Lentimicrobiaceae bacterium]
MKKYRLHIAIVLLTAILFNVATLFLPPNFRGLSFYSLLFVCDTLVLMPFLHTLNSRSNRWRKTFLVAYWTPFTALVVIVLTAIFFPFPDWTTSVKIAVATLFSALYFSHFFLCLFVIITCLVRWWSKNKRAAGVVLAFGISVAAGMFAVCLAAPFLWTVSPQVTKVTIASNDVPASFSGYRIVHLSDLHCDYFRNEKPLQSMVDSVNSLNPDLIVITGDVVTFKATELKRFLDVLQGMKAADGIYVVMGNHDYGSYYNRWESMAQVFQNQDELFDYYRQLRWQLLRNESVYIEKNGDTIVLAGTENQCMGETHYPCKGDFHLALQDVPEHYPVVLMTHDPVYW